MTRVGTGMYFLCRNILKPRQVELSCVVCVLEDALNASLAEW